MSAGTEEKTNASRLLPDVVPAVLITDEVFALLRDTSPGSLHPDSKILLASILFADGEGVAELKDTTLRHWCAMPGTKRTGTRFLQGRINHLIDIGALATGSTPTELRSMIGRRADDDLEAMAA